MITLGAACLILAFALAIFAAVAALIGHAAATAASSTPRGGPSTPSPRC